MNFALVTGVQTCALPILSTCNGSRFTRSISYHHGKLIAHDGEHPASKMGVPSWTTATPADNSWAVSEPLDRQDADRASLLVCGAVDRFRLPPPFRSLCEIQEARAATVHCGGTVGVGIGRGVAGSGRALPDRKSTRLNSKSLMRIA